MQVYNGILFIGDVFLSKSRPGRRLDENFFDTVCNKLEFALSFAKENNLKPVFLGSIVKKKFEISVYSKLISILYGSDSIIISGDSEYIGRSSNINKNAPASLLHSSGIITLASEPGVVEKIKVETNNGIKSVAIFAAPERKSIPPSIGIQEGVQEQDICVIAHKGSTEDSLIDVQASDWPGCHLFASSNGPFERGLSTTGKTSWLNTGPLVRTNIDDNGFQPLFWAWQPGFNPESVAVPSELHVFDVEGLESDLVKQTYEKSEFTQMLKEESLSASNSSPANFIENELNEICGLNDVSSDSRIIIDELMKSSSTISSALDGIL